MNTLTLHSFCPDAVVVAAGDFPVSREAVQWLERFRDRIYCCDGAADALLQAGYTPCAVVGDGDSISAGAKHLLKHCFVQVAEQETNDLSKTVRYAISQGCRSLMILGATGKREDHTLGNLSLLCDYACDIEVRMQTDYGCFIPIHSDTRFVSSPGQRVSFICLEPCRLTLEGLKWSVDDYPVHRWWQCTLNESIGKQFTVKVDVWTLVYFPNEEA